MIEPPHHVAILPATRTGTDADGHDATVTRVRELVARRAG